MSDPIVGHKTFRDGHHEPLRQSEANDLIERVEAAKAARAAAMPDEHSAIHAMFEAWLRLKELGWKDAIYCPKDGSLFDAIEPGSTGIHRCKYEGQWPTGSWWIVDGDLYPSRPVLFRASPDARDPHQEKEKRGCTCNPYDVGASRGRDSNCPIHRRQRDRRS